MPVGRGEHTTDPTGTLSRMSAFSALPEGLQRELSNHVTWMELAAGERLGPRIDGGESYHFIQRGRVNIILDGEGSDDRHDWQFIGSFDRGDFFSDGYARVVASTLDCVADTDAVLATVPRDVLASAMKAQPRWAEALRRRNKDLRDTFRDNRPASRRLVQDFFLRHGYGFANAIKVVQLDRCINCDACEKGCAARHGIARLSRFGPSLGALAFPISCRDCADHRCADACAFDAITVEDDGSVIIDNRKCVGCSACHNTCPNQAITMVQAPYTVADFPNPMPATDNNGLTNLDGLYLIGEASGDALIKIAINSGVRAVEAIALHHTPSRAEPVHDVAIVGAGPAGLSAALACQERGLRYILLDKGTFATTIQAYPRKKMVMAEPAHVPLYGQLWLKDATKEALLAKWQEIIDATGLEIQMGEEVTRISKNGNFVVTSTSGAHQAHNVIVAVGTRGAPRKLGLAGETPDRVHYLLTDPEPHAGRHVLVVGGGDSAIEAAASLADVGATVTLSYRRDNFGRAKKRNRDLAQQYRAAGKIDIVLESQVTAIGPGRVTLATKRGDHTVTNDTIFAMLGAEPPTKFFETIGIDIVEPGTAAMADLAASRGMRQFASKCDNCTGHAGRACVEACPTGALQNVPAAEVFVDAGHFSELTFLVGLERTRGWMWGAGLMALLIGVAAGLEAFLRAKAPEMSALHHWMRWQGQTGEVGFSPGRGLGLGLGIAGASLMLFACLYPLSSRLGWFQWLAKKRLWMAAHILAGVLGPVLVTWHTGFKLDRWPSIAFWAAWLVVLSGFAGRYLRSWFRRTTGLADLEMQSLEHERDKLFADWGSERGRTRAFAASDLSNLSQPPALLVPLVLLNRRLSTWAQKTYLQLFGLRHVRDRAKRRALIRNFVERARAGRAQVLSEAVTRSAVIWRVVHLILTIALVTVAVLHIVFGYLFMAT